MQEPISSVIIDDEQDARQGLKTLLEKYHPEIDILSEADNAIQGLQEIIKYKPNIIFLDIEMPGKDGFFVAKELQTLDIDITIIFVTAYDEYAIQAIKHAAFDFITKPIDPDELAEAISRYKSRIEKGSIHDKLECLTAFMNKSQMKFSTSKGFTMVHPDDIIYCLAEGNYTELFLTEDRKIMVTQQIGQIEEKLNNNDFVRISRSYLLNIHFIKEFNRKKRMVSITIESLPNLPVSRSGIKRLQGL